MDISTGSRLGTFEVTGKLGEGGMGQVYRAHDTKLGRDVALKVLPPLLTDDPDRLARFEREAKVLASLNHPNIAHVYDAGRLGYDAGRRPDQELKTPGVFVIVMELVEGPTLADRIAEGPIPIAEALPIARQIADALETAHEQGIIHRDLKPANVKVREDGTVKVLDFGLAKAFDPVGDQSAEMMNSPTLTARATQIGMILGTAAYMAPEQAKGKPVDRRADVWAFGVVLFEMLTGKRAFEGSDVSETLASVLAREADWSALPADTPAPIVKLLRQCLEKDRKERTPDIAVARFAIRDAMATSDAKPAAAAPAVGPTTPLWRQLAVWAVAAAVALLAAGATWWFLRPVPEPARVGRFTFALPSEPGHVTNRVLAISPSGMHVAFVADRQLWLRRLDDLEPTLLTPNADDVRLPFFSPDGKQIGFTYGERIKRVAIAGGSPVDVGGPVPERPFGVHWADDGFIYVGMENGIARMPETGGPPEMVIEIEGGERVGSPQLLPGGEWLLFVLSRTNMWDEGQVVVESLATHERRVLVEGARDARVVPTGHLLYVYQGTLFGQAFDAGAVAPLGGPVSLVDDLRVAAGGITGDVYYDVSSRGDLVYVVGQNTAVGRRLVLVDRQGVQTPLPSDPSGVQQARMSPDGRRIAALDIAGGSDIWLYDVDRPGRQRLTSDGRSADPIWSPDGEWVYYSTSQDPQAATRRSIWRRRVDLSGQPEEVLKVPDADVAPYSISADGRRLAIEVEQGGESYVAIADLEGSAEPIRLSREGVGNAREPSLSPDGLFVAYASAETGSPQIFVQEVATGRSRVVSTTGGTRPRWSGTGKEIIFPVFQGPDIALVKIISAERLEFSPPETLMRRPAGSNNAYDLSQDGQRLLLAVPEAALAEAPGQTPQTEIRVVLNWFEELRARVPVK